MSTAKKTASKTAKPQEATTMLRADHKLVLGLFEEFDKTKSASKKKKLVAEICKELTIHTQLEDEIFYPAFQQALKDHELVPEGLVEHQSVKEHTHGLNPSPTPQATGHEPNLYRDELSRLRRAA